MPNQLDIVIEQQLAMPAPLTLDVVGGFGWLQSHPGEAATSRFAPELMALVIDAHGLDEPSAAAFSITLLNGIEHDISFAGVVDTLLARDALGETLADRCFEVFIVRIRDIARPILMRTAALRGALALQRGLARRRASLKAALLWSEKTDDPIVLSHVARIAGMLIGEAPDQDLMQLLLDLHSIDDVRPDAAFELGMCQLGQALNTASPSSVVNVLSQAQAEFTIAEQLGERRPDATLLRETCTLLLKLTPGPLSTDVPRHIETIRQAAFAYQAYYAAPDEIVGMAKRSYQLACWSSLAVRLAHWFSSARDPAWYDAAEIIENELLLLYDADRTLLSHAASASLKPLIRPHLVAHLQQNRAQLFQLRRWLDLNGTHALGPVAFALTRDVDAALVGSREDGGHPERAGVAAATAPAIITAAPIDASQQASILAEVVGSAVTIAMHRASPKITTCLHTARETFNRLADYRDAPQAQQLYDALILQIMRFLQSRLDDSSLADPTVAYLFETNPDKLPREKVLQQDMIRFLTTSGFGQVHELDGVGGGRSDIVVIHYGIRIVIELKRELDDASWHNLLSDYGQQTVTYQNTNVRLGALLVLDLTDRGGLTPHMDTLWHCSIDDLVGDGARGVFVARVPGRRMKPNQLSA